MTALQPIADLLGITTNQLMIVGIVLIVLVVGWYILKAVLKIAGKVFSVGCFTILLLGGGLYLYFALLR